MPQYRIANLLIDSAVTLPGLPLAKAGPRAWRFAVDRRAKAPRRLAWYHHETSADGRLQRSLARDGECDVVRFWRRALFIISFRERRIVCRPCRSAMAETVRQLFIGHVVPLIFADRGALALHASAVRTPGGVLTFVGETRGGKSTIAAALGARGCPLVADDCAIVEIDNGACRVRPMNVGLRLWPDAMGVVGPSVTTRRAAGAGKRRVNAERLGLAVHERPAPLHRIYLLESESAVGSVSIEPVARPDAVVALLTATFQLGMDRPLQLQRTFENLSAVAARVPIRRLRRPRGLRHLSHLVDTVLDDAAV